MERLKTCCAVVDAETSGLISIISSARALVQVRISCIWESVASRFLSVHLHTLPVSTLSSTFCPPDIPGADNGLPTTPYHPNHLRLFFLLLSPNLQSLTTHHHLLHTWKPRPNQLLPHIPLSAFVIFKSGTTVKRTIAG